MKIAYLGTFKERKFEGRITLVKGLKKSMEKKFNIIFNAPPKKGQIAHIHAGGFFEAIQFRNRPELKIYTLYANILPTYFGYLRDLFDTIALFSREMDHVPSLQRWRNILVQGIGQTTPTWVKRHYLKKMDYVVLPNKWMKKKLRLPDAIVINQAINTKSFSPKRSSGNPFSVRYFGHPTANKGFIEVVDAFSQLKGMRGEIFSTITSKKLKTYVKKKGPDIILHGPTKKINNEYNRADIIVLPYRHHASAIATPLVLIEAMACGKPIITTDLPHLREIGGNSVIYVPPLDVEALVSAIDKLSQDSKMRTRLGKLARARAVKHYDITRMNRAYEKLYRRVFKENKEN